MSKLTKKEKTLLIILIVIIVLLGWYKLFFERINNKVAEYNSMQSAEETETIAKMPKLAQLNQMKEELEVYRANGDAKRIPLYDNSKPLMIALNRVLADADNFSFNFGLPDASGYIAYHNINLSYSAPNYEAARAILDDVSDNTFTNQVSDISISTSGSGSGSTSVGVAITFFEVVDDSSLE